jgi:hypothetical protein
MKRKPLTTIVHKAVVSSPVSLSVEEIAGELDKRPSTLFNELNPYHESTAKLGLEDAHEIMKLVGSPALLEAMAADLGYMVTSMAEVTPDKADIRDECLDDYPALVAMHDAIREGRSFTEVIRLAGEVVTEVEETAAAYRSAGKVVGMRKAG